MDNFVVGGYHALGRVRQGALHSDLNGALAGWRGRYAAELEKGNGAPAVPAAESNEASWGRTFNHDRIPAFVRVLAINGEHSGPVVAVRGELELTAVHEMGLLVGREVPNLGDD